MSAVVTEGADNEASTECVQIEHDTPQSSLEMKEDQESSRSLDLSSGIEPADIAADDKERSSISEELSEVTKSNEIGSNETLYHNTRDKDDIKAKNDDLKASLNAIFARNESRNQIKEEKTKEDAAEEEEKKDKMEDSTVLKKQEPEVEKKEDDKKSDDTFSNVVPDVIVEETEEDLSQGIFYRTHHESRMACYLIQPYLWFHSIFHF